MAQNKNILTSVDLNTKLVLIDKYKFKWVKIYFSYDSNTIYFLYISVMMPKKLEKIEHFFNPKIVKPPRPNCWVFILFEGF